jgi:hypothetical protein
VTLLTLVAQFASDVRVFPQLNAVATYWLNVQVCSIDSLAIQIEAPSTTAAP